MAHLDRERTAVGGALLLFVLAAGVALFLLSGCQTDAPAEFVKSPISDQEAFDRARKGILAAAKEPSSVKFGDRMYRTVNAGFLVKWKPTEIVCGTINGRNSFGGYTGFKLFAFMLTDDSVTTDEGTAAMLCKAI